jgi:hypothetical protein
MAMRCARRSSRQNGENGATNGDLNVRIGREAAVVTWQLAAAVTGRATAALANGHRPWPCWRRRSRRPRCWRGAAASTQYRG